MPPLSAQAKLKSFAWMVLGGYGAFMVINIYKSNEKFYKNVVMPLVQQLDPEKAHQLAIFINKYRLIPKSRYKDSDLLKVQLFGKEFTNPVGIAAGFDKHAEAVMGLRDVGFGFIEIGSVTPLPQEGNDKPRVFRLENDLAVINRYGFNSDGHVKVYERLQQLKMQESFNSVIGVNLGKNKTSPSPIEDYVTGIEKFGAVADYLVINISSPNTPGLRAMQNKNVLRELLRAVVAARNSLSGNNRPPLLLKLAPDLTYQERKEIAEVIKHKDCHVDGLIICNTTIERPANLKSSKLAIEIGGLSGKPLQNVSTQMIADMYKLTDGMTIIGVGGIFTGRDAYEKIKAGAAVVQLYTALVYDGPPVVARVKRELEELLVADGYSNISQAVGVDVR